MGHICMIILVFICQTIVYREVTRLFTLMDSKPVEDRRKDPWSKTLNWYFFATANYFLYGESIIYYFKVSITFRCSLPDLSQLSTTACCLCRCQFISIRRESSDHQFYPLHDRFRRVCHVAKERLPQAAIRPILLGAHDALAHCRVQVRTKKRDCWTAF